ncbi:hypothetical protein B0T18DRAFT_467715 [Schizothecium vesticola]|uniref:Uncharacterized protein n=1 Tax=Schizothecium vesticola TaxID=314040 RepID=A0AA40EP54_9PEZI|nr:hypothetical protein B0T18DRAFT_467715 [Schizothecium vesticola]
MNGTNPKAITFEWCHGVSGDAKDVIRGFKLSLDPRKREFYAAAVGIDAGDNMVHFHGQTTAEELDRIFKSAVGIVADFIGAVYEHALTHLANQKKGELEQLVDSTDPSRSVGECSVSVTGPVTLSRQMLSLA